MKRILFMPPEPWYPENHMEYLIRYFSKYYHMEQGMVGDEEACRRNPLLKNPDEFDLLIPLLPTHPTVDMQKYGYKTAAILWEPREGIWNQCKWCAATTPLAVKAMENDGYTKYTPATPGIDTELFKPVYFAREDSKLHVGVICCFHNPRHRVKEVILPLLGIEGVEFDFYVRNFWPDRDNDTIEAGGKDFLSHVRDGNKTWPGVANTYNRMDVLLKVDADPGLTFPIMEAAASGKPFIATNVGIEGEFANEGAGIVINADAPDADGNHRGWYIGHVKETIDRIKLAIEFMRDEPLVRNVMGKRGREYMLEKYTWEKQLPNWEEFFRKALS